MSQLPSASGVGRALVCLPSQVLPHADRPNAYSHRGTSLHAFVPDAQKNGRELALERVPEEWRAAAEVIDVPALPAGLASEVALAWDFETDKGREIGRDIGRNYSSSPTEFVGTADLLGVGEDSVFVADMKTGHTRVTPAKDNAQLATLALMACRAYGKSSARVALIHMREDGTCWWDVAELPALDLEMHASALRKLAERLLDFRIPGERPLKAVTGTHCRYCPAFHSCAAQTSLARALGGNGEMLPTLTPEHAAEVWSRIKNARQILDLAEEAVKTLAYSEPIALPGGIVLGPVETRRDDIDDEKAVRVLAEKWPDRAALAIDSSVTKKSLDRLVRELHIEAKKGGATLKDVRGNVIQALKDNGAISTITRTSIAEREQ